MIKKISSHPVYRFIFVFIFLFAGWFLLYDLWLHPQGNLDQFIIDMTIIHSSSLLEGLGYVVFTDGYRLLGIEGSSGVMVGDNCNAITLMALFSGFVISYPGKIIHKSWFIPAGILCIYIANIIRISMLAILASWSPEWVEFNHTYTFTLLMYGFIFMMWLLWANKISGSTFLNNREEQQK